MFGIFKTTSKLNKLEREYEKLMSEWHKLSSIDRAKSDLKYAEAHRKQLIIVDDFGRSRTLKNLIIQAKESNIDVKIFTDDTQLKTPIAKKIENNSTLEHISVCVCVKHILSNNSESADR